jgi:hypothetical protein
MALTHALTLALLPLGARSADMHTCRQDFSLPSSPRTNRSPPILVVHRDPGLAQLATRHASACLRTQRGLVAPPWHPCVHTHAHSRTPPGSLDRSPEHRSSHTAVPYLNMVATASMHNMPFCLGHDHGIPCIRDDSPTRTQHSTPRRRFARVNTWPAAPSPNQLWPTRALHPCLASSSI